MSGIALKGVNLVVFDDLVFCNNSLNSSLKCGYLKSKSKSNQTGTFVNYGCNLFHSALGRTYNDNLKALKCQQCKDHYQKAIESKKKAVDHRTQHQKQMDKHFIE